MDTTGSQMTRSYASLGLAAAVTGALLLTGCGSSDSGSASTAASVPASAPAAAGSAAANGGAGSNGAGSTGAGSGAPAGQPSRLTQYWTRTLFGSSAT